MIDDVERLSRVGMISALYARRKADAIALYAGRETRTFADLHARANQLARRFQSAGLEPGDGLAFICRNRIEWVEIYLACLRSGLRVTPVNWHLTGPEIAYIVEDCEARGLIAEAHFAEAASEALNSRVTLRLAVGGDIDGFEPYEAALAGEASDDPDAPCLGTTMVYTSGTTGRPKGVYRAPQPILPMLAGTTADFRPESDVSLCCGPAYHGGPLSFDIRAPQVSGVPIVLMERFDPEAALALIERRGVTHTHMVSTMFQRLLALPDATRARYDTSSLRKVFHGAAPTPPHVKRAMIDWFGPVIEEYYAATEGGGGFFISSEEWLRKPGSVGRLLPEHGARVLNAEGEPCQPGEVGSIYFGNNPVAPFSYFKDEQKYREAARGDHFTVGDMGYVDEDGYLFLTGRTAECIISGGVNIYPQEVDNVLLQHPAVVEVCTIGVPNDEWGEEVKSVVVLTDGVHADPNLAADIIRFARSRLAGFKAPRSVDFVPDLPRLESGKIQRRRVREPYWAGRERSI